jgi:ATP-binding cassette, subfamily C, type I secretion system permease/ATPase
LAGTAATGAPAVRSALGDALRKSRGALAGIGLFSGVINLLMLTGPLFMLQVYDRVLPSGSLPTLVGLAILAVSLYAFQGLLDTIRARVLRRIGSAIDEELSHRSYDAIVRLPLKTRGGGHGLQPVRDLDRIRTFLSSPGPGAMFDLPWIPLYVGVCFLFHPLIGLAAAGGAVVLTVLTVSTEMATRAHAKATVTVAAARDNLLEASRRNAEALQAMGMAPQMAARFAAINEDYLRTQGQTADRSASLSAFSRVIRLFLQSLVLGLGAYLVINQEASAGVIVASSILNWRPSIS